MPHYQNEVAAVAQLQRFLRQISYHEPSVSPPPIDGIFASDTQQALRDFQAWQHLPVTGIADRETWERLYEHYLTSRSVHMPPRNVSVFPYLQTEIELTIGNTGFAVTVLQHMLQELGIEYSALETVTMNGFYDENTAAAVKAFQGHNNLSVTGNTDVITWNTVTDQYNTLFAVEPFL